MGDYLGLISRVLSCRDLIWGLGSRPSNYSLPPMEKQVKREWSMKSTLGLGAFGVQG